MFETSSIRQTLTTSAAIGAMAMAFLCGTAPHAAAQNPNSGALTFTGGLDAPSVYVFRGLVQESDPAVTLTPFGELGIALASGDGAIKTVGINVGVWNSLMTGSSGSSGPTTHAHYEEDFYATLNLGLSGKSRLGVGYMARTSPNFMFDTVKELQIKYSKAGTLNPYGFVATELTDVQTDLGERKGTYLEFGVAPDVWRNGRATLAVPVKVGLSAKDYYELNGGDHAFGFFDVGGQITVPLGIARRFGTWNLHGGVDVLFLGDTPKAFNDDESTKVVGTFGIGLGY